MLIPPSLDGHQGAWPETEAATSLPHGFLYPLDIPSIHRVLRPLKGKIAAIRRDIKSSPPFRFLLEDQDSLRETDTQTSEFKNTLQRRGTREPKQDRHGPQRRSATRSKGLPSNPPPPQPESDDKQLAETRARETEVLVKRYQSSLASLFKDVLNRLWWRPYCDNNGLPINNLPSARTTKAIRQQHSSLAIFCAFAAGQTLSHVTDERKMESYYESIPPHLRRFAVLSHLVEMCISQVPVPQLKFHLAEMCVKYRADDQALRFFDDLLRPTNPGFFQLDLVRAYQLLQSTDVSDAWIALACEQETSVRLSTASLFHLALHAKKRHQTILVRTLVDHVAASSSAETLYPVRLDLPTMTNWTLSLIADSLVINNALSEDPSIYFYDYERPSSQCDEAISHMAHTLYTHPEAMVASGLEQVALALALHTLYLLFTADSQPPDAGEGGASTMLDWALLIDERTKELKDDDLDVVVRAFKTLPNLLVLVRVLDATELYSLAMTLLDRMIDDFSELKRKTSALLDNSDPQTNHITVRTLESMIDDIEQRRLAAAAASGWHYDYDLGHWAQQQKQEEAENSVKSAANGSGSTTSRDRFISILSDDDDDRGDDIDSTRLRPITRSITRNGRRLSLFSSASPRKPPSATPRQRRQLRAAKAIADEDDDGNDDGDDDDDDDIDGDGDGDGDGDVSSDTEMASALLDADWLPSSSSPPRRFSMAHYRRPLRESKRIVCYCTESDDDEEEDRDSDATRHTADGTREEDNYSSDEWDQEASCGPSESISLHSEGSMEEDFEERLVTVTKSDSSSVNDDISMENDSDCEVSSEHSSARRSLSAGSSIPLERAYWSEDDWDEVGSRGVNHFQKVDCTPSSSVSSETDTLMTPTGICSSEDDSDTEFLPPESKEARPVAVSRKRRRRRRGKVSFSDAWSGGTSASASSDGEYCPRAQHSFSARARQARKRRPQVEDELSGISIENAYSHDDGDDSDGDHKMEACMRDHLSRPLVDLSDIDSIEHDDSYHCHDARWEERQEEFSAEMNAAVESPSLVTVSLSGVLKDDASDTDRGDGGEVEDGSQYSASDGSEEADDEEWLPSIRFPKLRPPRRDPSPQHDQPLHLAVGEPLPLTEADELAF